MAAYDLEEQEQIENLKAWWRQHGNRLVSVVVAASLCVIAWQGWRWHQNQQSIQAGMLFSNLHQSLVESRPQQVRALAGELMEKFGGTDYAVLGALLAARSSFDAQDLKTARAQLNWAIEHGEAEVRDIAHLRLAGVMLDEKSYDEALQTLTRKPNDAFAPAYEELKADILLAQGKREESRAAYQNALALLKAAQDSKAPSAKKEDAEPSAPSAQNEEASLAETPAAQLLKQKLDALEGA